MLLGAIMNAGNTESSARAKNANKRQTTATTRNLHYKQTLAVERLTMECVATGKLLC